MATYYMRADGTAANKAAATGPETSQSACMNVSVHNGETFSAGDIIKVADNGGVYRAEWKPPSDGSSGSPITYENIGSPSLRGAELLVTGDWTEETGDEEDPTGKVFASGIEDEVDAFTTDFTGKTTSSGNTVVTSTAAGTFNSGTKGGKCTFGGTTANAYAYKDHADQTVSWARAYVKLNSSFALGGDFQTQNLLTVRDNTNAKVLIIAGIQCSTSPWNSLKWLFTAQNPSGTIYNSGSYGEVVLNTWYRITIKFTQGTGSDGIAEVFVDGVSKGTALTAQTWNTLSADRINVGAGGGGATGIPGSSSEIYFDDVQVDTTDPGVVSLPSLWYDGRASKPVNIWRDGVKMSEQGTKGDVDAVTEWWWDSGNSRVYVYTGGPNPSTSNSMEPQTLTDGIIENNQARSWVTFDGLDVRHGTTGIRYFNFNTAVSGIVIQNCTIDEVKVGIAFSGGGASPTTSNITIQNCTISPFNTPASGEWGIWAFTTAVISDLTIDGCNISAGSGEDAIAVDTASDITITNCTLGNCGENSIDIKDCNTVLIDGCTCDNDQEPNLVIHDDEADTPPTNLSFDITVQNCVFDRGGQGGTLPAGVYIHYSDNVVFRRNLVMRAKGAGIYVEDDEASANNNKIYYNVVANCGTDNFGGGIQMGDCVGTEVYNNVIYNQGTTGPGIYVFDTTFTTGVLVRNNIVHTTAGHLIRVNTGAATGFVSNYNLFFPDAAGKFHWIGTDYNFADWKTNSSQDANSPTPTDPLMIDPANGDFNIPATSPCVWAGIAVGVTQDFAGNTVGDPPDIGALQHLGNLVRQNRSNIGVAGERLVTFYGIV